MNDMVERMSPKAFISGNAKDGFRVGAHNVASGYSGPVACVSADDVWLNIVTDDYEGAAMLNIEALPMLQRALRAIAKSRAVALNSPGER